LPITSDHLTEISKLLQEGKNQEADDLLNKYAAEANARELAATGAAPAPPAPRRPAANARELAATGAAPAPPAPRPPAEITQELLTWLVNHLGNHPEALKLLQELEAAFAKL
jgi:hypothetical protein